MQFLKSLWRCLFIWQIPPAEETELKTAEAIVTQAFSSLKNGKPGSGNIILAGIARNLHRKYSLPILAQEEVAQALIDCSLTPLTPYATITKECTGGGWNTLNIAKAQEEICRSRGWRKVIVVAHPVHMGRAVWTYAKLGLKPLAAAMPDIGYIHPKLIHRSHRSKWLFRLRELCGRILFLLWGKI